MKQLQCTGEQQDSAKIEVSRKLCLIGGKSMGKVLCDLGAMPYSIFVQLGISEVKPTTVTL